MSLVLKTEGLTKYYGSNLGVENLNLEVREGEVFGLIGPNGAGKTTAIQLIAGIIRPTRGQIQIGKYFLHSQPIQAKSQLGLVPDELGVVDKLTAKEFIEVIGRIHGLERPLIDQRRGHFFKLFDLFERADDLLEGFSHGMRKKVQLIAALIHNPKLLLIDEPTAGLDPEMIIIFKDLIKKLSQRGMGILLATHYLSFAEEICDHVLMLNKGKVLASGTLVEIFGRLNVSSLEGAFLSLIRAEVREEELNEMVDSLQNHF